MGFVRIGWLPAVAAVAGVALAVTAGNWQTRRAAGKIALQTHMAEAARAAPVDLSSDNLRILKADALRYRHVRLAGTWWPEGVIYLENRTHQGGAGMFVLMPLRVTPLRVTPAAGAVAPAALVLVNRGWQARDGHERTRIGPYVTPAGPVTVEGVVLDNEPKLLELGQPAPPRLGTLWQNLDYDAYQQASGQAPAPLVIRQDVTSGDGRDGLLRDWPEAGAGIAEQIGKHQGYAFQWYGLATLLAGLTIFFELKKRRVGPVAPADPSQDPSS